MPEATLLQKFIDPALIRQLGLPEKMLGSLYVTALGMAITFIVLGLVWAVVGLFSRLSAPAAAKEAKIPPAAGRPRPETAAEDAGETVAVIIAAVADCLNVPPDRIRVRNITRGADTTPPWGRMGRVDQLNNSR
ncbi:MAG: OadG family protein [PVC group bacterium]